MLRTDALEYDLPPDRIATRPVEPRDEAKLFVVSRENPDRWHHARVRDLPDLLDSGDRLVVNTTRVLPARFRGRREDTGGKVEGLYLGEHDLPTGTGRPCWLAMIKSRRHKQGAVVRLLCPDALDDSPYALRLVEAQDDPPGAWLVELEGPGEPQTPEVLDAVGLTPLPPYILAARKAERHETDDQVDRTDYQTVYAGQAQGVGPSQGSVAAPTAGLHFTPGLLDRLAASGVERSGVVLHVGAGTFKPVESEFVEDHPIHHEWCTIPPDVREALVRTRREGGRVVGVGTTSARTLETFGPPVERGECPDHVSTDLLITPGFRWTWTDALLTNFHLPRSTLMALVGAMLQDPDERASTEGVPPGIARLKRIYAEAIERGYRFYSYGDAMLVL